MTGSKQSTLKDLTNPSCHEQKQIRLASVDHRLKFLPVHDTTTSNSACAHGVDSSLPSSSCPRTKSCSACKVSTLLTTLPAPFGGGRIPPGPDQNRPRPTSLQCLTSLRPHKETFHDVLLKDEETLSKASAREESSHSSMSKSAGGDSKISHETKGTCGDSMKVAKI